MNKIQFATDPGQKPPTLKTYITNYDLCINDLQDKKKYEEIKESRAAAGIKLFDGIDGKTSGCNNPDRELTLETSFIFGNQWNSAPDATSAKGYRVYNWHESIQINSRSHKTGHYLDITPEMRDICDKTYKCGYCGADYYGHENAGKFCGACLDSEYLEERYLHLLRLKNIDINGGFPATPELTEEEKAEILPVYVERQTTGNDSRNAKKLIKQRARIITDCAKAIENATTERDGFLWLMNNNVNIDNCIFYNHTGRFAFGWRHPLDSAVKSKLLDILAEFPFDYDIK